MDQKTIDDMVKDLVEERLKVLGKISENYDNLSNGGEEESLPSPQQNTQQKSVNSPALVGETPGKDTGVKRTLAEEFDKDTGVKRTLVEEFGKDTEVKSTLAEEFGSVAKVTDLDFVYVSPSKATKNDKDAKNELAPESDVENQEVVRSAVVKEYREKRVQLSPKGFALTIVSSPPVFPYIGEDGTTCMRKNVKPSSAIYDPLAPIDLMLFEKLMQHIKGIPPKPPAPADKPAVLSPDHESDFYSILIHERPWPEKEYGWVFDKHVGAYINVLIKRSMRNPTPFWSKRIVFIDVWVLSFWIHDCKQFKIKSSMITFKGNGYEDLINGKLPLECQTNFKWYEDVDHLYGCLQTGGNHWVTVHVDLKKEKIDCYDPIFGHATPESEQRILDSFKPLTLIFPVMLSELIPANLRSPSKKKFAFRRRSKRYTPQNTQIADCGVYSLKFVECLALGVTFDGINDNNIQGLRVKMAAEILDEGGNNEMNNLLVN
ncbi:PREDICTED: uncharacterized protein LOC106308816 [Brassica oleracea var. oleracea]|uniref:uncharacterized protein LOC106308816 n=1 Tax=Brassica oleracea var. oleracea TaxID=109376 RepID=UPI0006A70332|nr:PREDICTED: uncharacterized protein LOC106308816 [Brassica oleracea var. oleracea]